jgi:hypothetical protein
MSVSYSVVKHARRGGRQEQVSVVACAAKNIDAGQRPREHFDSPIDFGSFMGSLIIFDLNQGNQGLEGPH